MRRNVWLVGGCLRPPQSVVTAAVTMAMAFAGVAVPAQPDTRAVAGEWRSSEQFENQPRATVVVQLDGGALAGSLTLLGMTQGADDRATVRVAFRGATWDGTTLSFDTTLPGNEGKARWALRITATGNATLRPTTEDGQPVEDGPTWEMRRP
jgi:hypothetical protein